MILAGSVCSIFFFFQAEDGIRDKLVTGVQTCALPILRDSVRLEASSTYQVAGAGQNGGQPFELAGSGSSTTVSFIAVDGRYLGGESRDSAALTVRLPVQGIAIPVVQLTHTTVAVQP